MDRVETLSEPAAKLCRERALSFRAVVAVTRPAGPQLAEFLACLEGVLETLVDVGKFRPGLDVLHAPCSTTRPVITVVAARDAVATVGEIGDDRLDELLELKNGDRAVGGNPVVSAVRLGTSIAHPLSQPSSWDPGLTQY